MTISKILKWRKSEEDKKQVDIEKLGKLMTKTLFILSGILGVSWRVHENDE